MKAKQESVESSQESQQGNILKGSVDEIQTLIGAVTLALKYCCETDSCATLLKWSFDRTIPLKTLKGKYELRLSLELSKVP